MKAALISLGSVSSKWVANAMKKYFTQVDELDIRQVEVNLTQKGAEVLHNGKLLQSYDCIYAKGSYKYSALLRSITTALCDKAYMPIKASAFTTGQDKLLTQLKLQQSKIPMPTTYLASTPEGAKNVLEKINYPIVMKFPSGTQGKGVMFADSYPSASSMLDALATLQQPFIIQEYIETGGVDTRAIVIGDTVVAAMKRKAMKGEKRANIHAGGTGEACELDFHTKSIAIKTAAAMQAEICAVDILQGPKGPLVIELNLSPGLQGITAATKMDVADHIAKYLYQQTKKKKESGMVQQASKIMEEIGLGENSAGQQIITNIDFRANRMLLPKVITDITKITEADEVIIQAKKGALSIKKMQVKK